MTDQLRCTGCDRRFGRRARVFVVAGATALCHDCAASPTVHADVFFACQIPGCTALSHQAHTLVTRGRAQQLISTP